MFFNDSEDAEKIVVENHTAKIIHKIGEKGAIM